MKISIALCTYNGEKFLEEQLNSFLRQTRLPDEIVICDDGSNDSTENIVKNFSKKSLFPINFYKNKKNIGSTKNFEKAIGLCSGDLIFLSDQDDVWENKKIAIMESIFQKDSEVILAFSDAELVDENLVSLNTNLWKTTFDDKKRESISENNFYKIFLKEGIITGATACFSSELKNYILPIPILGNFIHDGWIALVAARIGKVVFLSETLIKYRQHSNQQIGAAKAKRQKPFSEILATHKKDLKEINELISQFSSRKLNDNSKTTEFREMLVELRSDKTDLIQHLEFRSSLPKSILSRFFKIFIEVRKGNYHRFERGYLTAGKDLLIKLPQ